MTKSFRRFTSRTTVALVTGMLLMLSAAFAQDVMDTDAAKLIGERPNASGPPVDIKVGIFIMDVDSIDDANQQFRIDMLLNASWQDSRLALPKRKRKGLVRVLPQTSVWMPRALISNSRGVAPSLAQTVEVDDLGNISYRQRFTGPMSVDLNFREFPFDRQYLPISLLSYAHNTDELQFVPDEERTGSDGEFSVEGWELTMLEPKVGVFEAPGFRNPKPSVTFVIGAERDTNYYMLTMFLPMTLIILMAWSVFWIQPDIIPPRISISTAAIFSFVAFGFTIRSNLPEVSYMTRADIFVTACTILVFLALGVAVAGSRLAKAERLDAALRLSAISRWAYLLLFAIVSVVAIWS